MADFRKLRVWQAARVAVADSYRMTAAFPRSEQFGLTSQIRRAAISIAANVAESTGRLREADQGRFLQIAKGSVRELHCELILAHDLGFLEADEQAAADRQIDQIDRMLSAMLRHLRQMPPVPSPQSPVQ